jgi:hypothetical protein
MIRNAQLLIAYSLLRDVKLAAELDGLPCGEDWAEMVLREAIAKRPEIAELSEAIEKAKRGAKKAWRDAHGLAATKSRADDQLP